MQLEVYLNNQLIETVAVSSPGYDPVAVINDLQHKHSIQLGDQIRIIAIETTE
jgi:hypothetical protein